MTNEEISAAEVAAFKTDKPESYFAYRSKSLFQYRGGTKWAEITTWTGEKLADVVHVGEAWTSNMGDKRQAFRARGVNGVTYSGTAYLSTGDYVRMRAVKGDA
jgi:hypothetical protein